MPIYEPGLDELVSIQRGQGRLNFTEDYGTALGGADIAMIAVNTPPTTTGEADVSNVIASVEQILRYARNGLVIAIKSTVPVGTGDQVEVLAREAGLDLHIVSNPEFLRQGSAISDFMNPDRVVVGAENSSAGYQTQRLYRRINGPFLLCSRRSAELAKYVSNALLATRVSFINEVAAICDATEADVEEVSEIVGLDHRIGLHYLKAGLGWGGSCLPKDVLALSATAASRGCSTVMLDAAARVNHRQTDHALEKLVRHAKPEAGSVIGILGLSFKPNTDDIRGAPSLQILRSLIDSGMQVKAHDPAAMIHVKPLFPEVSYCEDLYETVQGSDALILCTEWQDYRAADWARIAGSMRRPVVLDGRNVLDPAALKDLGFTYLALGRRTKNRTLREGSEINTSQKTGQSAVFAASNPYVGHEQ